MSSEEEGASTMLSLRRWSEDVLYAVPETVEDIVPTELSAPSLK